ncbi:hypothetical protein E3N88_13011 [Mikania micrantha]|uniref:NAB domain-containing protein n=1 Tax=Mikania micrantha TaxID=192012 RepID=A0A5N6P8Y9_9ASTR|nr:hypothetical protein E3N88_13011 [Mikania micrantha]
MEGIESKTLLPGENFQMCLSENVEGFQHRVKEILKLIEQDGNLSELTVEIYDEKKSKLTTHIAELSCMHGVLVDQHVHLIEEVSKNCPSLIKRQHLDFSDSVSPKVTQMFTPDQMSNTQKFRTPIGFDVLLSSGGVGSYVSRREGSESSFSLSSDSDSESFMSTNKLLISPINGEALKAKETKVPENILQKISNLEDELVTVNAELQSLADENNILKQQIQENLSHIKTQNVNFENEKTMRNELEKQLVSLKLVISESDLQIKSMSEEFEASRVKRLAAEDEILKLKHELSSKISKLFSSQQEIALLEKQLHSEKEVNLGLHEEVSLCVADISVRDDQITELNTKINQSMHEISLLKSTHKAKEDTWNANIERLQMELSEKCRSVDDLNQNFDCLKLKKDGVTAQLDTLRAEKRSQDNLVRELETRLNSLQLEHERVLSSFDNAQNVTNELKMKVAELEREVGRQREVISDRAEEKREAIRQLLRKDVGCLFSRRHFIKKRLRDLFLEKRWTIIFKPLQTFSPPSHPHDRRSPPPSPPTAIAGLPHRRRILTIAGLPHCHHQKRTLVVRTLPLPSSHP